MRLKLDQDSNLQIKPITTRMLALALLFILVVGGLIVLFLLRHKHTEAQSLASHHKVFIPPVIKLPAKNNSLHPYESTTISFTLPPVMTK